MAKNKPQHIKIFNMPSVLPDGNGGYTPCPEILTQEEAIRYLRLDTVGHRNPLNTLRYYRSKHKLKAVRLGKGLFYTRKELNRFSEQMTQDLTE